MPLIPFCTSQLAKFSSHSNSNDVIVRIKWGSVRHFHDAKIGGNRLKLQSIFTEFDSSRLKTLSWLFLASEIDLARAADQVHRFFCDCEMDFILLTRPELRTARKTQLYFGTLHVYAMCAALTQSSRIFDSRFRSRSENENSKVSPCLHKTRSQFASKFHCELLAASKKLTNSIDAWQTAAEREKVAL